MPIQKVYPLMPNINLSIIKNLLFFFLLLFIIDGSCALVAGNTSSIVSSSKNRNNFTLSASGFSAPICADSHDEPGVLRVLRLLQTDIEQVTHVRPDIFLDSIPACKEIVLVGTKGKSTLIDHLVKGKKLQVRALEGKWETFIIQVVEHPFPHVDRALVITGSDKRGTIYGMFELSQQIGVSPWYWWADVPIQHRDALYVIPHLMIEGPPSVKYRGIFLNDEHPDLTNWIIGQYGTIPPKEYPPVSAGVANYNHQFYEKIFELILRLKGNYLWPAMWNNAFNEDDPENPRLADEYGIVMGTSHQEPMLRAQKEWDRRYLRTIGTWNYTQHPDILETFWREGIRRNKQYESILTMGLRGANDTPMAPGGPEANMKLLEKIVGVQRSIIKEEINSDVTKVPQLWCLYKEVQDFYKAGMRVPDDVTLLWAEDNWGNVRRLPTAEENKRAGGAGVYYHFDYHGGPRSYQWLNTNPLPKIWDQLNLAKQYGADRIWIVNVGHFKGYELPLEYFMDLAWNTTKWKNNNINAYVRLWAERQFGSQYAEDIAGILSKYTKYNGRRKPELLSPATYSLANYREAETVVADFQTITAKAEDLYNKLPAEMRDAFYELVLFPTKASAIVNDLYVSAGKNLLYARQGRASTNDMAAKTQELFQADTNMMGYYNRIFAHGKWNHFMDQTHLGYTNWQDPPTNSLRAIKLTELSIPDSSAMGVAVEGSEESWPGSKSEPAIPQYDVFNQQHHFLEVFNRGRKPFEFRAAATEPWILLSESRGVVAKDKRIEVSIDWSTIPKGNCSGSINIAGTDTNVTIKVDAANPAEPIRESLHGFVEGEGYVSIEAEHYTRNRNAGSRQWMKIDDYGHTVSAMTSAVPPDSGAAVPEHDAPCLEYKMYIFHPGTVDVCTINAPTLNFMPGRGLRYAVSFDDGYPQVVTLVPENYSAQNGNRDWEKSVADNTRWSHSSHTLASPGYHVLKIWMVDPGVVLQKIIVNTGGVKQSYLGPPESYFGAVPSSRAK